MYRLRWNGMGHSWVGTSADAIAMEANDEGAGPRGLGGEGGSDIA